MLLSRSTAGLTWHKGTIPSDELWVKLGGDKGHGSFKMNLQLVNTKHPNSMKGVVEGSEDSTKYAATRVAYASIPKQFNASTYPNPEFSIL